MGGINLEVRNAITVQRVVIIALLTLAETIIAGLLTVCMEGSLPTMVQWVVIVCVGMLQAISLLLAFLRTGEIPEEKGKKE